MTASLSIPGYEILTCLGGGQMTAVYAARGADDRRFAVKTLRPEWQDLPVGIKLMQREARACLMVEHPHLAPLVETHVTRPPYFLVFELLPGESLRQRLRREFSLDVATALWITRQMAEALAALHQKGFLHGDVKPENIRLVEEGRAVLLDLGFAHRLGENSSLFDEGYILGTVDYLAPELCGPHPTEEQRSDLFSLGVTLFEMLSGSLPYPKRLPAEALQARPGEEPIDLAHVCPDLPGPLIQVVERLLAPHPQLRPRSLSVVQQLISLEIGAMRRPWAA